MEERYIRNIASLSEEEFALLRKAKVFVAGCGGLGGHIIDMLLRIGVGALSVADGDCFEPSNLNRQLLSRENLLGAPKAEAARAHAASVNSGVEFTAHSEFINKDNVSSMIHGCDAVIDALDGVPARKLLKAACDAQNIPYVFGAIHGWVAQAAISMPGDGLLDILYPSDTVPGDKSTLAFTPALCAALETSLCVRLLCGRNPETGRLHYFDLSEMDFETISL